MKALVELVLMMGDDATWSTTDFTGAAARGDVILEMQSGDNRLQVRLGPREARDLARALLAAAVRGSAPLAASQDQDQDHDPRDYWKPPGWRPE